MQPFKKTSFAMRHPVSHRDIVQRHTLLTEALRKEYPKQYPIEAEYPLIFADNNNSLCLFDQDDVLLAHLCLQEKLFFDKKIGLIANVATDASYRNRGYASELLDATEHVARARGYDALILWSDLDEFYMKQGFQAFGEEARLEFAAARSGLEFTCTRLAVDAGDHLLTELLALRPNNPTLHRSSNEFRSLLQIPDTFFYTVHDADLKGYFGFGKGADLMNVVHEFGHKSDVSVEKILEHAKLEVLKKFDSGIIIGPKNTMDLLRSEKAKTAPIGWIKKFSSAPLPKDFYIWGLDSV